MGIIFGLLAAFCWGLGDVLVTQIARRVGVGRLMIYFEGAGLLAVSVLLALRPATPGAHAGTWALMLALAVLNSAGAFLLYRAFTVGALALVAPVASGYAVVTGLLAFFAGERPPPLLLLGALLLIAGVVIVTRANYAGGIRSLAGLPEAIGVVLVFGVFYWALAFVTPALGILWPIFVLRVARVANGLLIKGHGPAPALTAGFWARVALAAVLSTTAFVSFNLGLASAYTTTVVTLASLASAVTVLCARVMLREQLNRAQWLGVGLMLLGVLLVSR